MCISCGRNRCSKPSPRRSPNCSRRKSSASASTACSRATISSPPRRWPISRSARRWPSAIPALRWITSNATRARPTSSSWSWPRSNSNAACYGRCWMRSIMPMWRRATFRLAPSCQRKHSERSGARNPGRCPPTPAARRPPGAQRGAGRLGAVGARAGVQGRYDCGRDRQALHRRGDARRHRRRSRQNLQRAAPAHPRRRDGDVARARRQEAVGVVMAANGTMRLHTPLGLLAELTHRCPLGCPYCSNPLALDPRDDELDTATWARVFGEAAALGVLQVHLSGGEPGARRDLVEITAAAHDAGLYTNLITSAVGITANTLQKLADAGLDHVQISIQDSTPKSADHIAGYDGAFARKRALAAEVVGLKIPLTVNVVVHRANIDRIEAMVALALALGASRVEIAHVQYYGWALRNRSSLMPSAAQVERATAEVEDLRKRHHGEIVIDAVVPDYYARLPKPCGGGWGRRSLNVTPTGKVLPCHAAESIPGLEFWSVRKHSLADIWKNSPAFNAFRGTSWMKEPCQNCARRDIDFGGCRCQAFALTGDAAATDPVCHLSPRHDEVAALAALQDDAPYAYRRM